MKNQASYQDVYQIITDLFIEKLEQGTVPWRKSWSAYGLAENYLTKKPYRGINQLILKNLHPRPFYLTFLQAKQIGGSIRKGSRSIPITYWNFSYKDKKTNRPISAEKARFLPVDQVHKTAFLKFYRVFNIDDIEGIDFQLPEIPLRVGNELILACERVIADTPNPPRIKHQSNDAYYHSQQDYVSMPHLKYFTSSEMYYSVLFHELIHATGHPKRLNRSELAEITAFSSYSYSCEELTAEIGASFLNCHTGILNTQTFEDSAAYIQGWLEQLRSDKKFIFEASSKAQKAVDYVLDGGGG